MLFNSMKQNQLWRMTLDTNPEDCNLHCIMCEEHSPYSNFIEKLHKEKGIKRRRMSFAIVEKIFEEAKALGVKEIIPSTMGEPLLYKDFDKMLELYKKYKIKCNLTTNGTFPKRAATEWAKMIVPVTSDIKISWNGATKEEAEKVMLEIDFDQAVQNVKNFVKVRNEHFAETGYYCRITFQLTFMQNNMRELAGIIKLAAKLDVDRVKGYQLWTHFNEIKSLSFRNSKESILQWNEYVKQAYKAREKYLKPNGKKILLEQITPLQDFETSEVPYEYECPFLNRELWISATGKISPCCAPDNLRQKLGDFGNIQNTNLDEILQSWNYQNLVKNYKNNKLCRSCNMRKKF